MSGFCIAQKFHLDLLPPVHKLDMNISDQQERVKVLLRYSCSFSCGDANKDGFNINFHLGRKGGQTKLLPIV